MPPRDNARRKPGKWSGGTGVPGPCGFLPARARNTIRRHMSPAPASKGRTLPTLRTGSPAVRGRQPGSTGRRNHGRKPSHARPGRRFPPGKADTVGEIPEVATVSQCGGGCLTAADHGMPSEGSGVATGTRNGHHPSRSESSLRSGRRQAEPRRGDNKIRSGRGPEGPRPPAKETQLEREEARPVTRGETARTAIRRHRPLLVEKGRHQGIAARNRPGQARIRRRTDPRPWLRSLTQQARPGGQTPEGRSRRGTGTFCRSEQGGAASGNWQPAVDDDRPLGAKCQ